MGPELRQLRYFVAVAEHRSFTRAAEELFVAQQALSQQIKAMEDLLGVRLFDRNSRRVELTTAGATYLADSKRLLAAADRALARVRAVADGEAGTLRVAYTLTAVYDTLPKILDRLRARQPRLKLETREIFARDVYRDLYEGRYDVAVAPVTTYPKSLLQRTIRAERLSVAVGAGHRLADRSSVRLADVADELFQLWPRDMAPGYYDAVVDACHAAGFRPTLDDTAAGSTAWHNIADGRGVNLVVGSLTAQRPHGITLLDIAPPTPTMRIAVVYPKSHHPAVARFLATAIELGNEHSWLP